MGSELEDLKNLLDFEPFEGQQETSTATDQSGPELSLDRTKGKTLLDFDIFETEEKNSTASEVPCPEVSQTKSEVNSVDSVKKISNLRLGKKPCTKVSSEIHRGDTDSSDDEDNRFAVDHQNYSETGRAIKDVLKKETSSGGSFNSSSTSWKSNKTNHISKTPGQAVAPVKTPLDVYSDPFFGIRIITPLFSSQTVREKMLGKTAVPFSRLEKHLMTYDKSVDWVTAGVILSKNIKTSQKGNPYVCWTLSDLRGDLLTVTVFLFGKAYKDLWKTSTHLVVAILNPSPLDHTSKQSVATLSVLNPDQIMIWGQSKDLGICKARKKNGEPCTSFVNKNQCEFCVYHVKQEYRKFSGRSELQAQGGSITSLRNKVLGKNEVFYAGKSYTAMQGKPSVKQKVKDHKRLTQLFNSCESRLGPAPPASKTLGSLDSPRVQLIKDAHRLQTLTGAPATLADLQQTSRDSSTNTSQKMTAKNIQEGLLKTNPSSERKHALPSKNISSTKTKEETTQSDFVKSTRLTKICQPSTKKPTATIRNVKGFQSQRSFDSQVSKFCNNNKKVPTKNRFDNLVKMKTLPDKLNESKKENVLASEKSIDKLKGDKLSCGSTQLNSVDNFDVSFDFDEERFSKENKSNVYEVGRYSKQPKSTATSSSKKGSQNSFPELTQQSKLPRKQGNISQNSSPTQLDDTGLRSKGSKINISPLSSAELSSSLLSQKPLKNQLIEIKLPTKFECQKNKGETSSNSKIKVDHDERGEKSNVISTSQPTSKKLGDIVHTNCPKLSEFGSISLTVPVRQSAAKANALKYVREKGPITNVQKEKEPIMNKRKKTLPEEAENKKDKETSISKRFAELMNVQSSHTDLISKAEDEAMDEYYEKMEKKEKMEEKMLSTYKVDCKAFKCLKCKYKWFSPSDLCKAEGHPIKVVSAVKRFFQCHNCKSRTVSLDIIPMHACKNCGNAQWDRAAMMRERKMTTTHLSIRGGEQTFVNSVVTDINLDLVVPDS